MVEVLGELPEASGYSKLLRMERIPGNKTHLSGERATHRPLSYQGKSAGQMDSPLNQVGLVRATEESVVWAGA